MIRLMALALLLVSTAALGAQNYDCSKKKYCKDMKSCEEARYYFERCGMKNLDRDKDGIPCENVCGKKK